MPIELNLPYKCVMWIDLAFTIIDKTSEFDSQSIEFKILKEKADYCLEMAIAAVREYNDGGKND